MGKRAFPPMRGQWKRKGDGSPPTCRPSLGDRWSPGATPSCGSWWPTVRPGSGRRIASAHCRLSLREKLLRHIVAFRSAKVAFFRGAKGDSILRPCPGRRPAWLTCRTWSLAPKPGWPRSGTQIAEREKDQLDDQEVAAAFGDFDTVWSALSPREQAQALALLVARVEYDAANSQIAVSFHPSAIRGFAQDRCGETA